MNETSSLVASVLYVCMSEVCDNSLLYFVIVHWWPNLHLKNYINLILCQNKVSIVNFIFFYTSL